MSRNWTEEGITSNLSADPSWKRISATWSGEGWDILVTSSSRWDITVCWKLERKSFIPLATSVHSEASIIPSWGIMWEEACHGSNARDLLSLQIFFLNKCFYKWFSAVLVVSLVTRSMELLMPPFLKSSCHISFLVFAPHVSWSSLTISNGRQSSHSTTLLSYAHGNFPGS